ncbi:MAG: YybH family protein [Aurantibacter sp.]
MRTTITALALCLTTLVFSQYQYDPSAENPFGLPNPDAPQQLLDFAPLIGECNCKSVSRKADQTWAEPVDMIWRWKYIMNGMGIQDETLKADGKHSGSIRQFIADSTKWYVHYYSSGSPSIRLPSWEGNKNEEGNIVLYREQKAPNGMEGYFRLTFSEMSAAGFKWVGEWVNLDETITYPTWKIDCKKGESASANIEKEKILTAAKNFSKAYMDGNLDAIANAYTGDGKIFPNNTPIIEGREAIRKRWELPEGVQVLHHELNPEEVNLLGNYAYDYGYYQGKTKKVNGNIDEWKGKYVVVWKKVENDWKMYLDIWNRVQD